MVMDAEPAVVGDAEISSDPGLLLVSVSTKPPAGAAWPRNAIPMICRFCPIGTPSVTAIPGALTLTGTDAYWLAMKPAGTSELMTVFPAICAWNSVVALPVPAVIVTGELVISPTVVLALVMLTLTGA